MAENSPSKKVASQKSELQTRSRSYSQGEPQNPNRIAQKKDPNCVVAMAPKIIPLEVFALLLFSARGGGVIRRCSTFLDAMLRFHPSPVSVGAKLLRK